DQPAEAAGALNAVLLLAAIILDTHKSFAADNRQSHQQGSTITGEEFSMRNTQLAALCGVILTAAGLIAASNWQLAKSVRELSSGSARTAATPVSEKSSPAAKRITVAMMPKSKGNAYFIACKKGADEAAAELGINLIWDGPTDTDPAKQNEVVETWITRQVDVIAVAVENREGLASVLRKARERGITVVTWDADTESDARELFVNQATPEGIGHTLVDEA